MSKKVELFSYRFACEYCGHIAPWTSKVGSPKPEDSLSEDRFQTDDFFENKRGWKLPNSMKTPLTAYKKAFAEGKYYALDSNVKCPSCKKVQYWSWNPNQTPKTLLDGLWLWAGLFIAILLVCLIPITLITIKYAITDFQILFLMYCILPLGLSFALAAAATTEANNIYHKNLHEFETVKAKNFPEIRWHGQNFEDMSTEQRFSRRPQRLPKDPPPLWESLSANQNLLRSAEIPMLTSSANATLSERPYMPALPAANDANVRRFDAFGRYSARQNDTSQHTPSQTRSFTTEDAAISTNTVNARNTPIEDSAKKVTARDVTARDVTARDVAARDAVARDVSARDVAARDVAARDAAVRDAARDAAARDAARDAAARDAAARDAAARDAAARDAAARDAAARDAAARDAAARDAAARDAAARDVRETAASSSIAARGIAAREAAKRGIVAKGAASAAANENSDRSMTSRHFSLKETAEETAKTVIHSNSNAPIDNKVSSIWEASGLTEPAIPETTSKRRKLFTSKSNRAQESQTNNPRETVPDKYQPTSWSPSSRGKTDDISVIKSDRLSAQTSTPKIPVPKVPVSPDIAPENLSKKKPNMIAKTRLAQDKLTIGRMNSEGFKRENIQKEESLHKKPLGRDLSVENTLRGNSLKENPPKERPVNEASHGNSFPRESSLRENSVKRNSLRENLLRESSLKENSPRENSLRENLLRESSLRESSLRKNSPRENSLRENSLRENSLRKNSLRENSPRENSLRENSLRKNSLRENPIRESSLRENSLRKNSLRESSLRESPLRKSPPRESSPRENSLRESSPRKSPPRENSLRENRLTENPLRENSLKKTSLREKSLKEKQSKRSANHDPRTMIYDVELTEVGTDLFPIMQAVRDITGLPFRQTQNLVESVPKILVSGVSQSTADSIKAKFNRLDAVVSIRVHK